MKKLILLLMGLFSFILFAQEKLTFVLETDFTSKWDDSFGMWSEYDQTQAHFDIYKDVESGVTTKIVAYMDSVNDYKVGTTFYVYRQTYENESNGQAFYFYINFSTDFSTIMIYDNSMYIKIIDEIVDGVSKIQLIGFQPEKLSWTVKNMIKK